MGQQDIQDFLMKENPETYFSTEKIAKILKNTPSTVTNGLNSMRRYNEIETVRVRVERHNTLQHCHRLTKKGRES